MLLASARRRAASLLAPHLRAAALSSSPAPSPSSSSTSERDEFRAMVRDFAAVSTCRALGEVRGSSKLGGLWADAAYRKAIDKMKRQAADLGATHVQIIDSASGFAGSRMIGTAFLCPKA